MGSIEEFNEDHVFDLATTVSAAHDADVLLYSGGIEDDEADQLIRLCKRKNRRKNVFLVLTTRGGSPHAGFRIARCLQTHYTKVTLYIHGMCKSAGTLVAIGADEIILSDYGEFGPLDVQLDKKDELFENTSGLDITQALNSLNTRTLSFFRTALMDIRGGSRGQISTKLAAEIASKLAVGAYSHIYSQVDPIQLGSIERAVNIAHQYGNRLARNNLHERAIDKLVASYPSHGFVIDLQEAQKLFKNVRAPSEAEEQLGECISFLTRDEPTHEVVIDILNEKEPQNEILAQSGGGQAGVGPASGQDHIAANPVGKDGNGIPANIVAEPIQTPSIPVS
jgi:hypothetical protein